MSDEGIEEYTTGETPGNINEARPKSEVEIPPWLDVEHPKFPRHFILSILDKDGEVIYWFERLPQHLRGKT